MDTKETITVIVPVYNAESYLGQCVESIQAQSYKDLDIILVNDGSTDNSSKMCDRFAASDPRVRVFHKANGGLSSAWRTGLLEADSNSEYIVFVDADDWIEADHVACMVAEQKRTRADIVVARMKQIYTDREKYIDFVAKPKFYIGNDLKEDLYPILLNAGGFEVRGVSASRCSKLIRKSLLLNNMKYTEACTTYEEDLNIMFPVFMDMKSISLLVCDNAAYCYRLNEKSMLHAYDKNMLVSIQHVYSAIRQACADKSQNYFENQIDVEYLTAMIRACTNEFENPSGLRAGFSKVKGISKDPELRRVLKTVSRTNFPLAFRLVTLLMGHSEHFWAVVLFYMLGTAKKIIRGWANVKTKFQQNRI